MFVVFLKKHSTGNKERNCLLCIHLPNNLPLKLDIQIKPLQKNTLKKLLFVI